MPSPTRERPNRLNPKQLRFVEEYLVDLNATQAALRAGYSSKGAKQQGSHLLTNPNVQAAISARRIRVSKKLLVTAENVVEELRRIAFTDRRALFTWGPEGVKVRDSAQLSEEEASIVEEVSETRTKDGGTVRVKTGAKVEALKLLGQHLGMFVDRPEPGVPVNLEVVVEIIDVKEVAR